MPLRLYVASTTRGGTSAWGYCLVSGHDVRSERGRATTANNYRAELTGLVEGLRAVKAREVLVLISNDTLRRTATEWLPVWRRNKWKKKGGSIGNIDLVMALAVELDRRQVHFDRAEKNDDYRSRARGLAIDAAKRGPPQKRPSASASGLKPEPCPVSVVAYTDGGCRGNPGIGGWGFLLIHLPSGRAFERRGGDEDTTNNRMEMLAAIEALESLKKAGQEIEIRTDSTYLKNAAESWMKGWKRRGWRKKSGEPIANVELVKRLDGLLAKYTVTWRRVPGHAGEPGNEYADMLTNHAMDGVQAGGDGNDDKRHDKSPVAVAYSR